MLDHRWNPDLTTIEGVNQLAMNLIIDLSQAIVLSLSSLKSGTESDQDQGTREMSGLLLAYLVSVQVVK